MEIQVSKETALFVEALKEANVWHNKVMEAAEAFAGSGTYLDSFTDKFSEAYGKMLNEVYNMMLENIADKVKTEGNNTI